MDQKQQRSTEKMPISAQPSLRYDVIGIFEFYLEKEWFIILASLSTPTLSPNVLQITMKHMWKTQVLLNVIWQYCFLMAITCQHLFCFIGILGIFPNDFYIIAGWNKHTELVRAKQHILIIMHNYDYLM